MVTLILRGLCEYIWVNSNFIGKHRRKRIICCHLSSIIRNEAGKDLNTVSVCVVLGHPVSVRTFGVMYDHTMFCVCKSSNHNIRT